MYYTILNKDIVQNFVNNINRYTFENVFQNKSDLIDYITYRLLKPNNYTIFYNYNKTSIPENSLENRNKFIADYVVLEINDDNKIEDFYNIDIISLDDNKFILREKIILQKTTIYDDLVKEDTIDIPQDNYFYELPSLFGNKEENCLYRTMSLSEIIKLYKNEIDTIDRKFISFTKNKYQANLILMKSDYRMNCYLVTFDSNLLFDNFKMFPINYEKEVIKHHIPIIKHIVSQDPMYSQFLYNKYPDLYEKYKYDKDGFYQLICKNNNYSEVYDDFYDIVISRFIEEQEVLLIGKYHYIKGMIKNIQTNNKENIPMLINSLNALI